MSPVRPRSPAPKTILSAVHFSHNSAGQKQASPAEARYPSGKGEVCKTFMRRFDPDPRLHILQSHSKSKEKSQQSTVGTFVGTLCLRGHNSSFSNSECVSQIWKVS